MGRESVDNCFDCERAIYPTDQYLTVFSIWQEETYRFHLHCALESLMAHIECVYEKSDAGQKLVKDAEFTKKFWKGWKIPDHKKWKPDPYPDPLAEDSE